MVTLGLPSSSLTARPHLTVTPLTPPRSPTAEDQPAGDSTYKYLTVDEMKSLGDDSMPMDVSRDEFFDRSHDFHTGEPAGGGVGGRERLDLWWWVLNFVLRQGGLV